ncbi:MAG: hypothetical protein JXA43_01895 [Candidatus Diapherotrites archaeon]|nr:hypothetical protein [Candidatus Diapherotrites archaeon]
MALMIDLEFIVKILAALLGFANTYYGMKIYLRLKGHRQEEEIKQTIFLSFEKGIIYAVFGGLFFSIAKFFELIAAITSQAMDPFYLWLDLITILMFTIALRAFYFAFKEY